MTETVWLAVGPQTGGLIFAGQSTGDPSPIVNLNGTQGFSDPPSG